MEPSHAFQIYLVANLATVLASIVQTATGMGFAMIAVPLLALINIEFVPGPMLFANLFLALMMLGDGRKHIVGMEIAVLFPFILIGTALGVFILTIISTEKMSVVVALIILISVAITMFGKARPLDFRNLMIGGSVVGMMGSTAGIPGAPLVILYQNEPIKKTRPTMAMIFTFSYITSLIALYVGGLFNIQLALDGLLLLPGLIVGFVIGKWSRQFMTQQMGRVIMLLIASIGAVLLLLKSGLT